MVAEQEKWRQVYLTEVLRKDGPRTNNIKVAAEVKKELDGQFEQR